ncbi:MAG TPA: alpha/beta fold hydrolase [Gemmatimonadales bacterium]|nr:alpha/beta fold hydrolase [Gemmatimonadales bacterium]
MATPTLTKHTLPGALGDILVDVRAGGRASARPAVVVLHGFKGFKDWGMFPVFSERLARAGVTAVTPNLSGSGVDDDGAFSRPESFARNTFSAELDDLGRVVDALAGGRLGVASPTAIGLVGHSRGGGIAVLQTARDPKVRSLVTWAAISSVERWSPAEQHEWRARGTKDVVNARTGERLPLSTDVLDDVGRNAGGTLDILGAAARVAVPWLIVHGGADEAVSPLEGEALKGESRRDATVLLTVDGAGHTFGAVHPWRGATPELERVFDASLSHLAGSLV